MIRARLQYIKENDITEMTILLAEALLCASRFKAYDVPSPTMDILRPLLESTRMGIFFIIHLGIEKGDVRVDMACFEMIPHCISVTISDAKHEKLKAGEDSVCVPNEYEGPVHSLESLRSLTIAYLYLFKWCLWDTFLISHGSHVARVLEFKAAIIDGLPKCIEIGELSSKILEFHPSLNGNRVLSLHHPSLLDRGLSAVSDFISNCQLTAHVKTAANHPPESKYIHGKKALPLKDGLSEDSIVILLQRIAIANLGRIFLIDPDNWLDMANHGLEYLRRTSPVLAGGFAGARMGNFSALINVFISL